MNRKVLRQQAIGFVARPVRRRTRWPFPTAEGPVLVHAAHHKIGTVWFTRAIAGAAADLGLRWARPGPGPVPPRLEVVIYEHSRHFDRDNFGGRAFRGTHMIRDPRDVIVSAFHYHKWSTEKWLHRPMDEYDGRTYQEELNRRSDDDALTLEIERSVGTIIRDMGGWDYDQPEFLELKYEAVFGDERATFEQVFRHFGFTDEAADRAAERADDYSFKRMTADRKGSGEKSHLRSGKPGGWRGLFTSAHAELFADRTGDLIERLGYEPTLG